MSSPERSDKPRMYSSGVMGNHCGRSLNRQDQAGESRSQKENEDLPARR